MVNKVIVVGGGMVGSLTALLLAQQGYTIHLIEKNPPQSIDLNAPFDLRVSAFSAQSKSMLDQVNVWKDIPANKICLYKGLQTWEAGSPKLTFDSQALGVDALGYIVENRWVQRVLWQAILKLENVHVYENREVRSITNMTSSVSALLDNKVEIEADLLIACDGANSSVRDLLSIGITAWDYRQHCMLVNIKTDTGQQDITWQEFRESGPCAFLPLAENNASLVWYHSPQKINQLKGLSNNQLKEAILSEFPTLPFNFKVENKGSFPLTRRHAQRYFKGRCVLLGDAAHTINPLAGQGVNLGFKDVECLINLLQAQPGTSVDKVLAHYQRKQMPANLLMQTGMDLFYKTSKSKITSIRLLRKIALGLAQNSGQLKNKVMKYAMGL